MPFYTVISEIGTERGYTHLTQHKAGSPAEAVSAHLGKLPLDIGGDDFTELVESYLKPTRVKLHAVGSGAWAWLDCAQSTPRIGTYVIETVFTEHSVNKSV